MELAISWRDGTAPPDDWHHCLFNNVALIPDTVCPLLSGTAQLLPLLPGRVGWGSGSLVSLLCVVEGCISFDLR